MTTAHRLHEHGIASRHRHFLDAEDYAAACTFEWRCPDCGAQLKTPKPEMWAEDDFTIAPECEECGATMEEI